jgi:hypothetical protein
MNIHTHWNKVDGEYQLELYRNDGYSEHIGYVNQEDGDIVIHLINAYETISFTEIDHITDCWYNQPKD